MSSIFIFCFLLMDRLSHLWPDIFRSTSKKPLAWCWACIDTRLVSWPDVTLNDRQMLITTRSEVSRNVYWYDTWGSDVVSHALEVSASNGHLATYQYLSVFFPVWWQQHCGWTLYRVSNIWWPHTSPKNPKQFRKDLLDCFQNWPSMTTGCETETQSPRNFLKKWKITPDDVCDSFSHMLRVFKNEPRMLRFLGELGVPPDD